jgi:DEAD/DEAH box helicase domain-containing protein
MTNDNRIVFDLETKKEFAEVGGYRNVHMLGVSVAGVYNYFDGSYRAYEESELGEFEDLIANSSLLIGFNNKHFDNQVIQPYFKKVDISAIPTLDILRFQG